ncbi:hypothetical protein KKG31_01695 [Patescibacteria group bacterium]|nr:hypothetical protein [Patescibacteria group bacterium]MBU1757886.1 hypothetical protein [Patescibacteria group bacterium]
METIDLLLLTGVFSVVLVVVTFLIKRLLYKKMDEIALRAEVIKIADETFRSLCDQNIDLYIFHKNGKAYPFSGKDIEYKIIFTERYYLVINVGIQDHVSPKIERRVTVYEDKTAVYARQVYLHSDNK